jgi:hypothetical protein
MYVLMISTFVTAVPPAFLASHLDRYSFHLNDEESDATDTEGEQRPEKEAASSEEKWMHHQWQLSIMLGDGDNRAWHHRPEDVNHEFPSKEIHSPPPNHRA